MVTPVNPAYDKPSPVADQLRWLQEAGLLVPESREAAAAPGNDLAGALLSVLGFGGIIFGLIEGRNY